MTDVIQMMTLKKTIRRAPAILVTTLALAGCATVEHPHPDDPWEGYNRAVFAFNEGVDKAVFKPLATGYDTVAPLPVKSGVGSFFGNLGDIWTGINNFLQGKGRDGGSDAARVLINSTLGIFGLFDVATDMGFEKHQEDLGQTLAVWGVGNGPYFVVPFFGPRTLRDAAALPGDIYGGSLVQLSDVASRNAVTGLRVVHERAALLGADRAVEEGSLDKYGYIRDFYLQQRRYEIYDGRPPRERFDDARATPMQPIGLSAIEADDAAAGSLRIELARVGGDTLKAQGQEQ